MAKKEQKHLTTCLRDVAKERHYVNIGFRANKTYFLYFTKYDDKEIFILLIKKYILRINYQESL